MMGIRFTLAAVLLLAMPQAGMAQPVVSPLIDARALPHVHTTDQRYQSFQIGFSHLTGGETWKAYDSLPAKAHGQRHFTDIREKRAAADLAAPRLRRLTAALAPLYIRFSGTTANSVYFHDNDLPLPSAVPRGFTVMLARERWKEAVEFAKAVDARIITSLANSDGVRDSDHRWTPRMARPWLDFTRSIGGGISAIELFNEPNAPEPPRIIKGLAPAEFARDYRVFSTFMAAEHPGIRVAGPGTATLGVPVPSIDGAVAADYAGADPRPRFDIFSYHYYPALAERCAPADSPQGIRQDQALTPEWLARPDRELQRQKALRDRFAPGAPLWLTETGGAACGGLRWQTAFLDSFRYLGTQARLARQGLDVIVTHALISGSNGIIDEKTLEPNASYWSAVLWRRLMGARVLDAGPPAEGLQLYAHCLPGSRGGVTVLALNLKARPDVVRLGVSARLYLLTAPDLLGREVRLNGQSLAIGREGRLPSLSGRRQTAGEVMLPAHSIAFLAMPGARNSHCDPGREAAPSLPR